MSDAVSFSAAIRREPVLVTGSNGYFASWLVRALCDVGFSAVIAGDLTLPAVPPHPQAQLVRLDVTDSASVDAAVGGGVRTVFHCAALVPFNLSRRYGTANLQHINVDGTRNVVNACSSAGVRRLVYLSSTGASFRGADIAGGDEVTALPPDAPEEANDAYSASKAAAEAIVLAGLCVLWWFVVAALAPTPYFLVPLS